MENYRKSPEERGYLLGYEERELRAKETAELRAKRAAELLTMALSETDHDLVMDYINAAHTVYGSNRAYAQTWLDMPEHRAAKKWYEELKAGCSHCIDRRAGENAERAAREAQRR